MLKKYLLLFTLFATGFITVSTVQLIAEDVLRPRDGIITNSNADGSTSYSNYGDGECKFKIGIEGGVNFSLFSQLYTYTHQVLPPNVILRRSTIVDLSTSGTGFAGHFALVGDYRFNETSAMQLRLGYEARNFGNSGNAIDFDLLGTQTDVSAKLSDYTNWLSVAANYRHSFTESFFMTFGLNADFLTGTPTEEIMIQSLNSSVPANNLVSVQQLANQPYNSLLFTNPSTVTCNLNPDIDHFIKNRFALEVGAGYDFKINKNLSLVPQARFQFFLDPLWKNSSGQSYIMGTTIPYDWEMTDRNLHNVQFLIALWYNF